MALSVNAAYAAFREHLSDMEAPDLPPCVASADDLRALAAHLGEVGRAVAAYVRAVHAQAALLAPTRVGDEAAALDDAFDDIEGAFLAAARRCGEAA